MYYFKALSYAHKHNFYSNEIKTKTKMLDSSAYQTEVEFDLRSSNHTEK